MSEKNKYFIPKDIKATPSSREKYEETDEDLKNLNKAFRIDNDSSDAEIERYTEVRKGLVNERAEIIDQAWDEAKAENEDRETEEKLKNISKRRAAMIAEHTIIHSVPYLSDAYYKKLEALAKIADLVADGDLDMSVGQSAFDFKVDEPKDYGYLAVALREKSAELKRTLGDGRTMEITEEEKQQAEQQQALEAVRSRIKEL